MSNRQTIAHQVTATGIALHAGVTVTMVLAPAAAGHGIVFRRADLGGKEVPALYDRVGETRLGTVIEQGDVKIGVIEHLMAALAGAGIDDLLVTLDGPEPPILDGDALSFLRLIDQAGLKTQNAPRQAIRVRKTVTVEQKGARASLSPADGSDYHCEIDFPGSAIGRQSYGLRLTPESFRKEIAPARTFGFVSELESLHKLNLGRGASLENTLALAEDKVLNAPLMRFADEFVRHKILDAVGDLALVGAPILGRFDGFKSGHGLNNALLRALFSDPAYYEKVMLP